MLGVEISLQLSCTLSCVAHIAISVLDNGWSEALNEVRLWSARQRL